MTRQESPQERPFLDLLAELGQRSGVDVEAEPIPKLERIDIVPVDVGIPLGPVNDKVAAGIDCDLKAQGNALLAERTVHREDSDLDGG